MNKQKLGAELVEQLLARGLTEHDLTLLAENSFAADRAAVALTEVVTTLCLLVRNGSRRHHKLTVRFVDESLKRAGSDAHGRYASARDTLSHRARRRNRLAPMG